MPEVPEAFEDEALSVSMFEIEDEATRRSARLAASTCCFASRPIRRMAAGSRRRWPQAGATLERITVERVAPEDWARADRAAPAAGRGRPVRRPRLACPRAGPRRSGADRDRRRPRLRLRRARHHPVLPCRDRPPGAASPVQARARCRLRLGRAGDRRGQMLAGRACSRSTTTRSPSASTAQQCRAQRRWHAGPGRTRRGLRTLARAPPRAPST